MPCDSKKMLETTLDDFNWMKTLSSDQIDEELSVFDFPDIKTMPMQHQKIALLLGLTFEDFMFYLDMGLGKTAVMLYLIAYLKKHDKIRKALVVVPDIGNIDNWVNETSFHTYLTPISIYGTGTAASKRACMKQKGDLYIINYMGLQNLMTELQHVSGSKSRKRFPIQKLVDEFSNQFDLVVFDEIQNAGNVNSLVTELCTEVASRCIYRYGLTGTPFGRDLLTLWSQFYLIDGGRTLSDEYTCFRKTFFDARVKHMKRVSTTVYEFKQKHLDKLKNLMATNSLIYEESECANLPKQIFSTIPIRLNKVSKELYGSIVEARRNDEEFNDNVYSKFRQICSGFYYNTDPDTGERLTILLGQSGKIDVLLDILDSIPPTSKFIIFHVFTATGDILDQALTKHKIKHVNINRNSKDRAKDIRSFVNNKSIKGAIASLSVASTGLNLQVANYCINYELCDGPRTRQQSLKRIHRTGQKKTTYYYDLVTVNSVEEKVQKFLQEGKSLRAALLSGKVSMKDVV